jgi:lysophospholipase L1-like esterase
MKFIITIIALAICTSSYAEDKHLFILSGQSNMARLQPKDSFVPAVEKAFGKDNVTVVKNAKIGRPISNWYKADNSRGSLYNALMKSVKKATAGKSYTTVTYIWMQGERDAKKGNPETYAASFKGMLTLLKSDLNLKSINFVIGRLSDHSDEKKWLQMRDVQAKLAEDAPNGEWVDTDDLNNITKDGKTKNDLHYSKEGYKKLGERFAEKAIKLIKK